MKKIQLIFLTSLLLLSACGEKKEKSIDEVIESENLSEIRARKSELNQRQQTLKANIEKLNAAIEKLDKNDNRTLVTTQVITDTLFKHYIEVQGSVGTDQNIIIYPEYSGVLTRIYIEEGQRVSQGQILAKIDDGGLASQLAQLKTNAALAKTTYERQKRLWDQQIGSEIQYLEAKANYESTQSAVEQMESQLAKTVVRAPFSGTIDQVITDEGQVVTPGQSQLFRLINLNQMYIEADVPENYLESVQKGSQVLIEIPSIGKEFEGEVKEVSSFINPNNRSFKVKVAVPNNKGLIKPNLITSVKLNNYTAQNAITVPQSAIKENAEGDKVVFVVNTKNDSLGVAKRAKVQTGKSYNGQVEIVKGLKTGQHIVVNGARSVRNGEKVQLVNN